MKVGAKVKVWGLGPFVRVACDDESCDRQHFADGQAGWLPDSAGQPEPQLLPEPGAMPQPGLPTAPFPVARRGVRYHYVEGDPASREATVIGLEHPGDRIMVEFDDEPGSEVVYDADDVEEV